MILPKSFTPYRRTVASLFVAWIIFVIIVACSNRHPDYPFIDGYLTKAIDYSGDTIWDRYVEVFNDDGLPMIPIVKLNGEAVELYDISIAIRLCTYWDSLHFATNKEYQLTVDHYYGQAQAKVWMPGDFSMIDPKPDYILQRDSALVVTWHKSANASWYWFSIYLEYDFEDSLGGWDSDEFKHDTIVYDTIVRYAPNRFFSENVKRIVEGEAQAGAWACDGPNRWQQGTKGNIRGQGFGFFSATYQPKELDFFVGAPPKIPKLQNKGKIWKYLKEKIRQRPD